jgi:hypothetical protein
LSGEVKKGGAEHQAPLEASGACRLAPRAIITFDRDIECGRSGLSRAAKRIGAQGAKLFE